MTEQLRQSLSAVIDDEADAFELRRVLDELERDAELREQWDRYHMIGSALRGEGVQRRPDLRERIWRALAEAGHEADEPLATVTAAPPPTAAHPPRRARFTPVAVAASLLLAVAVGFGALQLGGAGGPAGVGEPDVATAVAAPGSGLAGPEPAPPTPAAGPRPEVSRSDLQRAHAYMLHHTQQQALNQAGVMSFVKMATYEAP
jgi:sigma-E factor negative regulatory protein RseA